MLSIRSSPSKGRNPDFCLSKRTAREDNADWIARNLPKEPHPCLVLLGGKGPVDFRLRVAQSHARHDLTPSHWSHVALLEGADGASKKAAKTKPRLWEISLEPPTCFGYPPSTNGVQESTLERYADRLQFPNVAVIYLPVSSQDVMKTLRKFMHQRSALDATELVLAWLAYVWGVGRAGNPLIDGKGIPSATMVEYVLGALQYELTPGLDSRSSCPEAIWQSALWWHDYYQQSGGKKLTGRWVVEHNLVNAPH